MSDDDRYPDTESDADKRAYHNLLERKRRDHIKDSFTSLRDVLPAFKGEKVRASRAQILKKAADFIQTTRRRNLAHRADIEDLKRENILLEDQIRILQNAVETGNLEEAGPIIASRVTTSNPRFSPPSSSSDSDSDLDEDSTDSDDSSKDRRKRLKVSHKSVKHS